MGFLKKLFGGDREKPAAAPAAEAPAAAAATATAPADPWEALAWVEAADHPAGLRCLDCRAIAALPIDPATVAEQAARFAALRTDGVAAMAGRRPEQAARLNTSLRAPVPSDETRDGPLFVASALEDKWDVLLAEGWLYFRRSWSGQLIYRVSLRTEGGFAHLEVIEAPGEAAQGDPEFCVREVDFLVKRLLYGLEVPHPLPTELHGSDRELAEFSFQRHGRAAHWATWGDTVAYDAWANAGR